MTDRARWIGTVLLVALLIYSKSGGGLPVPVVNPVADKLWVVTLDDVPSRTPSQTIALDASRWQGPNREYEHYWKPSAEAAKYAAFSKFADEAIFMDATSGKVLGVVEIPAQPTADWGTSQIARFTR